MASSDIIFLGIGGPASGPGRNDQIDAFILFGLTDGIVAGGLDDVGVGMQAQSIIDLARTRRARKVDGRDEIVRLRRPRPVPRPEAPTAPSQLLPTAVPLEAFADRVERQIAELIREQAARQPVVVIPKLDADEQALLLLLSSL